VALFFTVGSHNQNTRSLALDGEVAFVVAGWSSLFGLPDFFVIVGLSNWIDDLDELEELFPPLRGHAAANQPNDSDGGLTGVGASSGGTVSSPRPTSDPETPLATRRRGTSLVRRGWCGALSMVGLLACDRSAFAQEASPAAQESQANYAFSTQLGSGIYKSSGGTVQVYRVGGSFTLRSLVSDSWGLQFRIPVTFGFYNFKLSEVLESGLPDRLATLALVPEVRFEFPLAENWQLMPFAAAGAGRDFSVGGVNYIFAGGVRSRATFDWRTVDLYVGNRLFYTGYATSDFEFGDDFGALESGVDARHSLGFAVGDHQVDGGLFVMNYLYFVSPDLVRFYGKPLSIDVQFEFGVTFGTMTPWKVLGLAIPRIGISYRVGSGASAFRLVLGEPFS